MPKIRQMFVFIFILVLIIDQLSKYLIRALGGFYIYNYGISFGLKIASFWFYPAWFVIISWLLYIFFKFQKQKFFALGIIFILSGAFSNILDRWYYGGVVDFIKLPFWPYFNLADTFIVFGGIISVYQYLNLSYVFKSFIFGHSRSQK